jgi:hypothetical protein
MPPHACRCIRGTGRMQQPSLPAGTLRTIHPACLCAASLCPAAAPHTRPARCRTHAAASPLPPSSSPPRHKVLRLDEGGKVRRLHVKRRDLLREFQLQPRDLRRVDPAIDFTKTSPSITIKESVLLLNLGGIRAIVIADKALLFEPNSANTRKLLDTIVPRLQAAAGQRAAAVRAAGASAAGPNSGGSGSLAALRGRPPPFELEVLEGVLTVATGRLDAEVLSVTRRVSALLTRLPHEINPVNLEELRRIKQALVELENKADAIR